MLKTKLTELCDYLAEITLAMTQLRYDVRIWTLQELQKTMAEIMPELKSSPDSDFVMLEEMTRAQWNGACEVAEIDPAVAEEVVKILVAVAHASGIYAHDCFSMGHVPQFKGDLVYPHDNENFFASYEAIELLLLADLMGDDSDEDVIKLKARESAIQYLSQMCYHSRVKPIVPGIYLHPSQSKA